jgi:spermidine/putrescine transport system ATP-binding protein
MLPSIKPICSFDKSMEGKTENNIITIKHLSHAFGDKTVLDDINLSIKKGEFVTILGPSGCGKTTLMRLIGGFLKVSEGEITIAGNNVTDTPPHLRPVNTVFQRYALFPHLNVFNNIAFGLKLKKFTEEEIKKRVMRVLKMVTMTDYEERDVDTLSGGQQQRVAIARAIVNEPEVLLLDEPLAALDLKMRKDMQMEIKTMHKELGITFVYITHDQEEALTLSDTIVVMREGRIQQIGTPTQIYNEPENSFVADFIGESNILNGTMIQDCRVEFIGHKFECVDKGFGLNEPVDVVVRPEDIYIFEKLDAAQFSGKVTSSIFKGVHYEMMVNTPEGYEIMVQDYNCFDVGDTVGLLIKPNDIQVMRKERICNTFEGTVVDKSHVRFLGSSFKCRDGHGFENGNEVKINISFNDVILMDNEEDGTLSGVVSFILYKGDHYHLTVLTEEGENIYVDTNDIWDDGDRVGISIAPESIQIGNL